MKGKIYLYLVLATCLFIPGTTHAQTPISITASSTIGPASVATAIFNPSLYFPDETVAYGLAMKRVVSWNFDTFALTSDDVCYGWTVGNFPGGATTTQLNISNIHHNGSYDGPSPGAGSNDCGGSGYYFVVPEDVGTGVYYLEYYYDSGTDQITIQASSSEPTDTTTRIIDFLPENATTTQNPVYFELNAYINSDDLGTVKGVSLSFHNIDQNVLLLGALSPNDIWLLQDEDIETSGFYSFSTSTILIAEGNYRIEACIKRSFFGDTFGLIGGWIIDAFSDVNDCQSHQFIVGTSTFIGNISQNLWSDTQDFFGNSTATSSEALAITCNPFSSQFGIRECGAFLFVPDAYQLSLTMTEARRAFLSRVPWGYFSRTIEIMSSPATSSLPSFTTNIRMGAGSDMSPATTSITFDIGDMVAGASAIVDGIRDPIHNQSFRSVFEDWIKGGVALLVILTIIADIAMSHKNDAEYSSREKTKLS